LERGKAIQMIFSLDIKTNKVYMVNRMDYTNTPYSVRHIRIECPVSVTTGSLCGVSCVALDVKIPPFDGAEDVSRGGFLFLHNHTIWNER